MKLFPPFLGRLLGSMCVWWGDGGCAHSVKRIIVRLDTNDEKAWLAISILVPHNGVNYVKLRALCSPLEFLHIKLIKPYLSSCLCTQVSLAEQDVGLVTEPESIHAMLCDVKMFIVVRLLTSFVFLGDAVIWHVCPDAVPSYQRQLSQTYLALLQSNTVGRGTGFILCIISM